MFKRLIQERFVFLLDDNDFATGGCHVDGALRAHEGIVHVLNKLLLTLPVNVILMQRVFLRHLFYLEHFAEVDRSVSFLQKLLGFPPLLRREVIQLAQAAFFKVFKVIHTELLVLLDGL